MPGVQRFFSKSVPAVTVAGSTPGCAPTRTTISFDPCRRLPEISKKAAVKHGRCSPAFLPFTQTAAPNCALLMRRTATLRSAGTSKVRRYQNQLRCWRGMPAFLTRADAGARPRATRFWINWRLSNSSTSGKAGTEECASPGTGVLCAYAAGSWSASTESAISHCPSSESVFRCAAQNGTASAARSRAAI